MIHIPSGLLVPFAILIISLLVIIHEFGHYLVARAFGMRVITYSIGFGPVIKRWRPKGSETVFQIAAIPHLAYVQIAGMNPRETTDPNDRGSYQNASSIARFLTIAAGPLANYLATSVLLFIVLAIGGEQVGARGQIAQIGQVLPQSIAAAAGLHAGDTVRRVDGVATPTWESLVHRIHESQGHTLTLTFARDGHEQTVVVTPRMNPEIHHFAIGIAPVEVYQHVSVGYALESAVIGPARGTVGILSQLKDMITRKTSPQLVGPVGMVQETVRQAQAGWRPSLEWAGIISLQLFIFNLLPIPALDGGRLMVLGYEMITRRKPNPRIEAQMLAWSLMLMIGLFVVVTSKEIWGLISGLFHT